MELLSDSKKKLEVQQDLLWVFGVLGHTNCLFSWRLAHSTWFLWTHEIRIPPLNFLISRWNSLAYFSSQRSGYTGSAFSDIWGRTEMGITDLLQQPASDSVLLQILAYEQALSPTWDYIPGEQSAWFSTDKNTSFWGAGNYPPEFGWRITKHRKYLPLPGAGPAFRSIPSSIKQAAVRHLFTICKY